MFSAFVLASLAIFGSMVWLGTQVFSHYDSPPLLLAALGLTSLMLLAWRLPPWLWIWWGLGLLTGFWSLTPANTLVGSLWELLYLSAFAAGTVLSRWPAVFMAVIFSILAINMFNALVLSSYAAPMYFSGSLHYVLGAQGLLLAAVLFAYLHQKPKWGLLASIGLLASLYAVLMSSARAAYVPFVLIVVLLLWRLWQEGTRPLKLLVSLTAFIAALLVLDFALPFSPIQSALSSKASISQKTPEFSTQGSFGSRLQMWEQTLGIAFKHPFGTGNMSFKDTIIVNLKYPGTSFSNAHNYYLETAATGGWPRLALLVGILVFVLWRGWTSTVWPWSLGAAGLWTTFAFDVTGMYPSMMVLAFAILGTIYGQTNSQPTTKNQYALAGIGLAVAVGIGAWWYWPCSPCAIKHLGFRPETLKEADLLEPKARLQLLEQAAVFNPQSFWVYRAKLQNVQNPTQRLEVLRKVTQNFPLASPLYYLEQANLARQLGYKDEAIVTLQKGLGIFPPGFRPAAVPLGDAIYEVFAQWELAAPALLKQLQR
jgi:O-antigen ligase